MSIYEVKRFPEGIRLYEWVVFSTCYRSPLEEIEEIELQLKGYKGIVLFDLLLCNGIGENRFTEGLFDGERFLYPTFKAIDMFDDEIRGFAAKYYYEHPEYLPNSILPKTYQFLIKKNRLHLIEQFTKKIKSHKTDLPLR